jgi:hypothetical protein
MSSKAPIVLSPSLFAFAVFYGGMVCIAGVLGNKQAALGPLAVEAGIFAFLLLVVSRARSRSCTGRPPPIASSCSGSCPCLPPSP